MVYTRSQKRSREEELHHIDGDNTNTNGNSNGNSNSNISLVKRRRGVSKPSDSSPPSHPPPDHLNPPETESDEWEDTEQSDTEQGDTERSDTERSDTERSDTEQGDTEQGDTERSDTEQSEDCVEAKGKQSKEKQMLNVKLKPNQVQQIIKESIKQLVKKYRDDEREFLDDNSDYNEDENDNEEPEPQQNVYEELLTYIDGINSGDFFERIPIEERKRRLKNTYSEEEIKAFIDQLESIHKDYKESGPSVIDILKMNVHVSQKQRLLEKIHQYNNSEVLSAEYNSTLKYLTTNINKTNEPELFELEKEIMKSAQSDEVSDDYRRKILKSKMSFENKVIAYKRLEVMERYEDSDSSEFAKYKNWMDMLLSVPFGKYVTQTPSLNQITQTEAVQSIRNVRQVLDKRLSFLEKPKDQIINVVARMLRNDQFSMNAIGLYGPPGVGKSSIVKSIAEALGRPYRSISLGGESDASLLAGHGFTYVGSSPGRIIEILSECKAMNPIVLLDECDKISQTHHGKEIIGTLIHLTDTTTNHRYNYDRYFAGVEFDLSKVLFVFTYNDPSKVDKILADRLFKIKVDNYSFKEKLEIANKHLIDEVLDQYKFTPAQISFTEEAVNYIIQSSRKDEGMRDIKRKFEVIVSRINTLVLTNPEEDIIRLKYKSLYPMYSSLPVTVHKEHIDTFLSDSTSNTEDSGPPPFMYI
ncbi:MAG: AAA family ATPase [Proteobacteria bacterium]|nr:AAA family ATPase [Pseudomonadota bacterium]